jgi:ribonuclease R
MALSKKLVIEAITAQPDRFDNKALARHLGIKGEERRNLRAFLRELEEDGLILKSSRKTYREADALPGVMVIRVIKIDEHGDMIGTPETFKGEGNPPQVIVREGPISKKAKGHKAAEMGVGGRALCRIKKRDDGTIIAQVMKKLGSGPSEHLGVLYQGGRGWRIKPVSKKARDEYKPTRVPDDAENNDLVFFRSARRNKGDLRLAEITRTIGSANGGKSASLISLHENEIPIGFSDEIISEAKALKLPALEGAREDLRQLPLITIDPVDAKDFDDAVLAHPDENPKNKGGWVIWVAIADVAAFVTPGSALDIAAREKGNSVYLPDRVEPMLPHELSSDLCSLRPNEDRACMAVRMVYDRQGHKISHKFHRGIMRSHARLTYAQAQDGFMGSPGEAAEPVLDILQNLYAAYGILKQARAEREPLAIELPERRVHVNEKGEVTKVTIRDRFDAHKLIEEFMVQANVAAAEALDKKTVQSIIRLHEAPDRDKLQGLMDFLPALDLKFTLSERVTPKRFNRLLKQAEDKDLAETVGMAVLRSQSQAVYSADGSSGHFGLNLRHYAHFTSPIRRYADLVVHRALIKTFNLGEDGTSTEEASRLKEIAEHISSTERRAMVAERDAKDRYIAAYLEKHIGAEFDARITGVTKFGLFITLDETGADGLIPARSLGEEYYAFDEKQKALTGIESGKTFKFGRQIRVRLKEATPVTGGLTFEMLSKGEPGKAPKRNPRDRGNYSRGPSRGKKHKRRRR